MADSEPEALLQRMSGPTLSAEAGLGQGKDIDAFLDSERGMSDVAHRVHSYYDNGIFTTLTSKNSMI